MSAQSSPTARHQTADPRLPVKARQILKVQAGLLASPAVSDRLHLVVSTLPQAERTMNRNGQYAAVVIPANFTAALLNVSGLSATASSPAVPQIEILTNERAGTVGTQLATVVLQPEEDRPPATRETGPEPAPTVYSS
jgi:hypothetical protein